MMIDDANIWRFNSAGGKEMHDYRVTGNYVCDNTQSALALARNHLGIVFAPNESVQLDIEAGALVPCFSEQHEWWLDLVAIFRKREYQPGEYSLFWMRCWRRFASSLLRCYNSHLSK